MIYLMIFLGVFNIEEHPRYEEVKKMFIEAVERHPEIEKDGPLIFNMFFKRGLVFMPLVMKEMMIRLSGGKYSSLRDINLKKSDSQIRTFMTVWPLSWGTEIVMGEVVSVFDDTIKICRDLDRNYLLKVDRVFWGDVKVGDTIQIKFFGNTLSFSPSGPDYTFMGGDTIIAALDYFARLCIRENRKLDVGYKLPFFIPVQMNKVTGVMVVVENEKIRKKSVPFYIEDKLYNFDIPLEDGIRLLEHTMNLRESYFKELYDKMTPELMDSFFVWFEKFELLGWEESKKDLVKYLGHFTNGGE